MKTIYKRYTPPTPVNFETFADRHKLTLAVIQDAEGWLAFFKELEYRTSIHSTTPQEAVEHLSTCLTLISPVKLRGWGKKPIDVPPLTVTGVYE